MWCEIGRLNSKAKHNVFGMRYKKPVWILKVTICALGGKQVLRLFVRMLCRTLGQIGLGSRWGW